MAYIANSLSKRSGCVADKSAAIAKCYNLCLYWTTISEECFPHLVTSMALKIKAVLKVKATPVTSKG